MRILVIVPITGLDDEALRERMEYLSSIARPDTEVEYLQVKDGPPAIESAVNHLKGASEVIKHVRKAEEDGYDAIISWCGGDPGVEEARTMVDIPVIGPGESMRLLAALMGKRVGRVSAPLPVLDLRRDLTRTYRLVQQAIESMAEEGYDAFWLDCLGMWGMGRRLREQAGLPVVDGAEASLKVAEVMVELGLRPSRISYPIFPPPHRR